MNDNGSLYRLSSYDYSLPEDRIAAYPAEERDRSRLLLLERGSGAVRHHYFRDLIHLLSPGDCLVVNDSKVFGARFFGRKESGGKVELLFLHYPQKREGGETVVTCLARSSKSLKRGQRVVIRDDFVAEVMETSKNGQVVVALEYQGELQPLLDELGHVPLPPYIRRPDQDIDKERYQTVYAQRVGSVAAPTAGLHFSGSLLSLLEERGIEVVRLTLHVGYGTFAPIRCEDIRDHHIHKEWMEVPDEAATRIQKSASTGGRVVAVGTTVVRALETAALETGELKPYQGFSSLYIYPGFRFNVVHAMITNFHLPKSSLLVLVSAFAGRENIMRAYSEALEKGYRFYSYGDAMLILP